LDEEPEREDALDPEDDEEDEDEERLREV